MTDSQARRSIDRRGFMIAATGIAASWALPIRVVAQVGEPVTRILPDFTVPDGWVVPFGEPDSVGAVAGTAGQDLVVRFAKVSILEPDASGAATERIELTRTYNGKVPGPTFRLKPGDKLEFKITNDLPPNQPAPPPYDEIDDCHMLMALNVPGCFNTTNLHTHGLHVSPKTQGPDIKTGISSDDVLVRIPPKNDSLDDDGWPSERQYCVWLPQFHAPGTHWYHAHVHGSTALQVVSGLAGALIVEEPEDQKIRVDQELIWILQEILGNAEMAYANISVPPGQPGAGMKPYGDTPPTTRFTVNSLTSSTIVMRPNEIQRWRFINATATPRGFMTIGVLDANDPDGGFVEGVLHVIADDGITYYGKSPQPVTPPGKFLAAGNRTDFLAKFTEPGTYFVWKLRIPNLPTSSDLLAIVKVEGEPMEDRPLPALPGTDKAPCYLKPISDDEVAHTPRRTYEFGVLRPGEFGGFTINGEAYGRIDPNTGEPLPHPNTDLPLGNAEEWTLTNSSGAPHPYHIHVNPFQVIGDKVDPDGLDDPSNWRWLDTVALPTNGSVRIRSRFLTYDGHFVMHCHILVHEDVGMMQDMTVVGDGHAPCTPVTVCEL
jgi:FtsP/CotA-like multicopper oxidase with cupredoxin domain